MSGTPFQTKFTIGLLTIEPCPPDSDNELDVDETLNDVNAKHEEEKAAKAAIAAKKAKKVARQKSRSQSPGKKPTRTKSRSQSPTTKERAAALAAKKKQAEQEQALAAKKKAEEEAAAEAAALEAAKKKKAEEEAAAALEAAKKKAEEEAAKKKAEEEAAAARKKAQEAEEAEAARRKKKVEEEEAARQALAEAARLKEAARKAEEARLREVARKKAAAEEQAAREAAEQEQEQEQPEEEEEASMASELDPIIPQPTRVRPRRRISMFPASKDNEGLTEAVKRYGNNVPFDWEKPEWTKEHVNLKHTSTINKTYGWEKPDWARRSVLKKTMLGDVVKQGASLSRPVGGVNVMSRRYLTRRHSLTGRSSFDATNREFGWTQPEWARRSILRPTEFGVAARQGANLAVPVHVFKTLAAGGSEEDLGFNASIASLNASAKNIVWEKPSWAVNPSLKQTGTGLAVRQGADLSLPPVGIREVLMGEESARSRTRTRSGEYERSPNSSYGMLDFSEKNVAWEKPSWTNVNLKRTSKGEKMKTTGTLAKPITANRD